MERRMFETSVTGPRGPRLLTFPASMAVHTLVVAAAIVLPLLSGGDLPRLAASGSDVIVVEPQVLPAIPPPPAPVRNLRRAATPPPLADAAGDKLVAPAKIPDEFPEVDLMEILGKRRRGEGDGVRGGDESEDAAPYVGFFRPKKRVTPATASPVRVAESQAPSKLKHVQPVYPPLARQARIQGVVVLECVITPQGRVVNAHVVESPPLLGEAAREAVLQWVYTPMIRSGVPVPILLRVRVIFTLN